ncbi:MAG: signal peptidase I [Oscillospiraceae bacterium]|nr:signal peptidase I [Oscillospiraceae bacterium]
MMKTPAAMTEEMNPKPVISQKTYKLLDIFACILAFLAAFVLFFGNFGMAVVPSPSMYPTLEAGSKLFHFNSPADKLNYDDIVVFFPNAELVEPLTNDLKAMYLNAVEKEVIYVKRVIGLPGDVLEMKDGYVYRNGEKLDPEYIAEPMNTDGNTYIVPEGHLFCMGDNRNNSYDSRLIGAIPFNNFFGKVLFHS